MQAWDKFLERMDLDLGKATVEKWLKPIKVLHFDACNLYLEAEDSFQAIWFEEHIRERARKHLLNNNNTPIKVHLTIADEKEEKTVEGKTSESSPYAKLNLEPDTLDPWATFPNFIPTHDHPVAYKLLSELTGYDDTSATFSDPVLELGTFNPILIYGPSGVGKTHLLMATAKALQEAGQRVLYARAETFTDHVVNAIRIGAMREFRKAYRHVDVLIIDDVHLFAKKNATQEELFHTFNTLHTSGKQIILSSNTAPHHLQHIEPRLISRFEWGIALKIEPLKRPELQQLIFNKAASLNLVLNQEVINFLLETFKSNTKSIHQAIDSIVLNKHLGINNRTPFKDLDIESAKILLAPLIKKEEETALSPDKIIGAVAEFFGIKSDDILGKSQRQECATPRQIAMYLCRNELNMPFTKIGDTFSRDHSTVMSSVRLIQKKLDEQDKELAGAYTDIVRRIKS